MTIVMPDATCAVTAPFDVTFEFVTPVRAQFMLEANRSAQRPTAGDLSGNRSLSHSRVARYADDLRDGFWETTHQGIAFDEHGSLLDGQHRLEAIVLSGQGATLMVCYGVPRETFWLLDGGFTRNAQSFLTGEYRVPRTALARTLMRLEEAGGVARTTGQTAIGSGQYPAHRILRYIEEHAQVREYGMAFSAAAKRATRHSFLGTSTVGLLIGGYLAGEQNWVRWWEDVHALVEGDGVEAGNPLRALFRMGRVGGNMTNVNYMRAIYTAVKYRNGETLKTLREPNYREIQVW